MAMFFTGYADPSFEGALGGEYRFLSDWADYIKQHFMGKTVLIKDNTLLGAFDADMEAFERGVRTFGCTAMLVYTVTEHTPKVESWRFV